MIDPRCGMNMSRGTVRPGRRMGSGRSVPAGLPIGRVQALLMAGLVMVDGAVLGSVAVAACSVWFFGLAVARRRPR